MLIKNSLYIYLSDYLIIHGHNLTYDGVLNYLENSQKTCKANPVAKMFFKQYYYPDNLYEIGLQNQSWLSKSSSLNSILVENKIFRLLGIIMYAPVESIELIF